MKMSEEILQSIADELHNMNINLCELIKTIKEKQTPQPVYQSSSDIDMSDIEDIHTSQIDIRKASISDEDVIKDNKYKKNQEGYNNILKRMGL